MPDLIGIDKGVDELTTRTLPEFLAGLNSALDRLETLLSRLDGARVTLTLGPQSVPNTTSSSGTPTP